MAHDKSALSILIVDDYRDSADSLRELLGLHGFDARTACDAVSALTAPPTDVVILEVHLRGVTGWDIARAIRERPAAKPPFVVAVTTCGLSQDRLASAEAGVDLHLLKPADPAELVAALKQFERSVVACV